jgi:mannose-6-phosphate isomerase-like protein (cupin superfamily)
MKKIIKLNPEINPITFKDGRGIIQTYYPEKDSIVEWNYIVTLKGAVRGHHYHKEFDEYIMFVDGEGVYTELSDTGELVTPVSSGDCIYIPMGVPHTFYPTADCKMIAMITKRWNDCAEPITRMVFL